MVSAVARISARVCKQRVVLPSIEGEVCTVLVLGFADLACAWPSFVSSRWQAPECVAHCAFRPDSGLDRGGPELLGSISKQPRMKDPPARSGLTMLVSE